MAANIFPHCLSKCTRDIFCKNQKSCFQRGIVSYCNRYQDEIINSGYMKSLWKHVTFRSFSRNPKSWFKNKRTYEVVTPGEVGTKRQIPDYILKPSYYDTGIEIEPNNIEILSKNSIENIRQSCSLARIVLHEVEKFIKPDVTTDELDAIAHDTCIKYGAYPSPLNYRGFPKSICTSVNNIACHGIPDDRKLKDGDIISVDISVYYKGFHGDCASTCLVGNVDEKAKKLVKVTALCLQEAIKICHHKQYFSAIGKTISKIAVSHGFSVVPAFCGHGIGSYFHCPPSILHYENEEEGQMLKGMIFTIEPVICEGSPDIVILEDGWTAQTEDDSRSAQFEHTILITDDGAEILTVPDVFIKHQ
ncbi:methionine aminopeptidase 1D, mitochondrial-like [Argiope bruennichi]|uniref:Methionine aminopeptidase n=1 Tax=Argiope bruennichi TaxID=94029 RepID=A0A8T0FIC0_ARGBR|nr:methionine aminopeptidase 1D, mitochondrial-like [Argiope bruennichi]XP_055925720.1 methionine aminopeptidase 1D, mitochondrial-like [Argiope bruennichi]KAF8789269.1 Methionine aminopeptidase 1D like protein [Argiope bruennichi]